MYSQLIYFIIALLLFVVQQPGSRALHPPLQTFILALLTFSLFAFACRRAFRPFNEALSRGIPQSALTALFHRTQNRLSVLALGMMAIYVYVLDIKFYLQLIPGFEFSLTLAGMTGVGLYLAHLGVIWFWSHPFYRQIYRSDISLKDFLKGNFAFNSAILVPWFLISFITDLLQIINLPPFLNTDPGQFLLLEFLLIIFLLFAPWLVVRLWGCETLPETPVRAQLEDFCRHYHFRVGDFMLWPLFGGEMLTAGVIGILPRFRYILITNGLLKLLDIDELKAVVAHEMGHVRRFHLLMYLVFFTCYAVLAYAFHDIILLLILKNETFLHWATTPDTFHLTLFSIVYSVPILLLLIVYFRYVFGFFMRNSERQADLYALELIGHPLTLISSLRKIAFYSGQIEDLPSWHHFSISERINFLLESHRDQSVARMHHRKLYASAFAFLIGIAALSTLGFSLGNVQAVKAWQMELQTRIFETELAAQPRNPELYAAYGGLLFEQGRYEEAEAVLQTAVAENPKNASALNNLAWLYARAPAPYSHPVIALDLAQRAAALSDEPHVLDTLAEAYFINDRIEEAIEAIQRALSKKPSNRDYYLQQRRKFYQALETR